MSDISVANRWITEWQVGDTVGTTKKVVLNTGEVFEANEPSPGGSGPNPASLTYHWDLYKDGSKVFDFFTSDDISNLDEGETKEVDGYVVEQDDGDFVWNFYSGNAWCEDDGTGNLAFFITYNAETYELRM